jgi:hypothetical protein
MFFGVLMAISKIFDSCSDETPYLVLGLTELVLFDWIFALVYFSS